MTPTRLRQRRRARYVLADPRNLSLYVRTSDPPSGSKGRWAREPAPTCVAAHLPVSPETRNRPPEARVHTEFTPESANSTPPLTCGNSFRRGQSANSGNSCEREIGNLAENDLRRALQEIVALDLLYPSACCEGDEARDAIVAAWTIARRALGSEGP